MTFTDLATALLVLAAVVVFALMTAVPLLLDHDAERAPADVVPLDARRVPGRHAHLVT